MTLRVDAGQHHDLVLEISDRPLPGAPPDPDAAWSGDPERLVRRGARVRRADRGARCPACLRRAGRADRQQRRDGRRRHHLAARATGEPAQLRLPLRVDPGPVLRRPGRGGARPAPAAGRDGAVHHRAGAERRPGPDARLHRARRRHPGRAPACGSAATRAAAPGPATGSTGSSSSTRSARCSSCWPRRPGWTGWMPTAGGPRRPRWPPSSSGGPSPTPDCGSWTTGTGRTPGWPARPACGPSRPRPAGPPGGQGTRQAGGLDRPGRPDHGQPGRRGPSRPVAGSAPPTTTGSTPPCCCR